MIMVLSRATFDTFWQIMVGFRPTNLKLRSFRVWITFLAFYVLNTESERISKKYVFDKQNKLSLYFMCFVNVNLTANSLFLYHFSLTLFLSLLC
jgi:hypothetical protein